MEPVIEVTDLVRESDGPVPLKLSQGDYITRLLGHPRHTHAAFSTP